MRTLYQGLQTLMAAFASEYTSVTLLLAPSNDQPPEAALLDQMQVTTPPRKIINRCPQQRSNTYAAEWPQLSNCTSQPTQR